MEMKATLPDNIERLVNQLEEKNLTNERLVNTYVSKVANFSCY